MNTPPPRLGLNIDHVATLRQARGEAYPSLVEAAQACIEGGASSITTHLREDRRHIQDEDVLTLLKLNLAPLNLEMAPTTEMIDFACEHKPFAVCLVPERREELTTEGGLRLNHALKPGIQALKAQGIRVSLFVEPEPKTIKQAAALGANCVELHTGTYANLGNLGMLDAAEAVGRAIFSCAKLAAGLGLEVHAGHGLHAQNLKPLVDCPSIVEYNIGHSVVCRALFVGLEAATRELKVILESRELR